MKGLGSMNKMLGNIRRRTAGSTFPCATLGPRQVGERERSLQWRDRWHRFGSSGGGGQAWRDTRAYGSQQRGKCPRGSELSGLPSSSQDAQQNGLTKRAPQRAFCEAGGGAKVSQRLKHSPSPYPGPD